MWAASHNQVATLKFLQEQGADFSMVGHQAETALLLAAANGHAQVLQVLLSAGVDINHICQVDLPLFFFLNVSVRCTYCCCRFRHFDQGYTQKLLCDEEKIELSNNEQ